MNRLPSLFYVFGHSFVWPQYAELREVKKERREVSRLLRSQAAVAVLLLSLIGLFFAVRHYAFVGVFIVVLLSLTRAIWSRLRQLQRAKIIEKIISLPLRETIPNAIDQWEKNHNAAKCILQTFQDDKLPFILCLRNFSTDATECAIDETHTVLNIHLGPTFEDYLRDELGEQFRILGIQNQAMIIPPNSLDPSRPSVVPRLVLPHSGWQIVVIELIRNATLIVVDLPRVGAGVEFELETIRAAHAQPKTIVVLPDHIESENVKNAISEGVKENVPRGQLLYRFNSEIGFQSALRALMTMPQFQLLKEQTGVVPAENDQERLLDVVMESLPRPDQFSELKHWVVSLSHNRELSEDEMILAMKSAVRFGMIQDQGLLQKMNDRIWDEDKKIILEDLEFHNVFSRFLETAGDLSQAIEEENYSGAGLLKQTLKGQEDQVNRLATADRTAAIDTVKRVYSLKYISKPVRRSVCWLISSSILRGEIGIGKNLAFAEAVFSKIDCWKFSSICDQIAGKETAKELATTMNVESVVELDPSSLDFWVQVASRTTAEEIKLVALANICLQINLTDELIWGTFEVLFYSQSHVAAASLSEWYRVWHSSSGM